MIIEHARDMLKRERLFFDKMQAHIGEVNGTISIGCSSLIGQTLLPEVLSLYNNTQYTYGLRQLGALQCITPAAKS